MRKWLFFLSVVGLAVPASANGSDCRDAIDKYKSALSEVQNYTKRYYSCVASSAGKDDCSFEFLRLKNAQDDFESAVSSIRSKCGS